MKILFVPAPRAKGCNAAWELALYAAQANHSVWWFGAAPDNPDTPVQVLWPSESDLAAAWGEEPTPDQIVVATQALTEPLHAATNEISADLICSDGDAVWGGLVAEALGLACVTYSAGLFRGTAERRSFLSDLSTQAAPRVWSRDAVTPDIAIDAERQINRLRAQFGLPARVSLMQASGQRHLLFSSREVEFDGVEFSENVRCVGPICRAEPPPLSGVDPKTRRAVMVLEPELWEQASELSQGANITLIGPGQTVTAGEMSSALAVYCSGHFETIQNAIFLGLPALVAPRSPNEDIIARRIDALGLGRVMDERPLSAILDDMARDDTLWENLTNMSLQHRMMPARSRALRLLEQVASGEAGTDAAERRLPLRPRFARQVGIVSEPDGSLTIGSYHKTYRIEAGAAAETLIQLWQTLDGRRTTDEVLATSDASDELVAILDWLDERELLEDATGSQQTETARDLRYGQQIALFAHASGRTAQHPETGGTLLQDGLARARVGVLGTGVLGTNLARGLTLAGIGKIHLAGDTVVSRQLIERGAWFDEDDVGLPAAQVLAARLARLNADIEVDLSTENDLPYSKLDFLVVTAGPSARPSFDHIGQSCHAARLPWTSLRRVRWNIEIGPTVIPDMTACYCCFEARRAGALASDPDRQDRLSDLEAGSFQWAIGPELVCIEAVKFLTGFGEATSVGNVLVLTPLRLGLSRHPVLRLPDCPVCGRNADWRSQAVWREALTKDVDATDA